MTTLTSSSLNATRNKRRELSTLLEQFYYSDDGTVGHYDANGEGGSRSNGAVNNDGVGANGYSNGVNGAATSSSNDGTSKAAASSACPLHKIKQRNGRCPLCAAVHTRELRRRRSCDSLSCCDDVGAREEEDDSHPIRGESLLPTTSTTTATTTTNTSRQNRSVRSMHGRLSRSLNSNKNQQEDLYSNAVQEQQAQSHQPQSHQQQSQSSSNNIPISRPNYSDNDSLNQLRQMILMAHESVGRFTPRDDEYDAVVYGGVPPTADDDVGVTANGIDAAAPDVNVDSFVDTEDFSADGAHEWKDATYEYEFNHHDDDDNDSDQYQEEEGSLDGSYQSISSMARMKWGKNFAESKGLSSSSSSSPPWKRQVLPSSDSKNSTGSHNSINKLSSPPSTVSLDTTYTSDSSVTLFSLSSKESFGSSSSSSSTNNPQQQHYSQYKMLNTVKEHGENTVSPTSVMEETSTTVRVVASESLSSKEETIEGTIRSASKPRSPSEENTASPTSVVDESPASEEEMPCPPYPYDDDSDKIVSIQIQPVKESREEGPYPVDVVVDEQLSDDEITVAPEVTPTKILAPSTTATSSSTARNTRRQCSFISALIHNSRRRSKSRGRSRSKSRTRSKSRGRRVVDTVNVQEDAKEAEPMTEQSQAKQSSSQQVENSDTVPEPTDTDSNAKTFHSQVYQRQQQETLNHQPVTPPKNEQQEPPQQHPQSPDYYPRCCPKYEFPPPPPGVRGPIYHPDYQLGDPARDQDMIIFPSYKSRKGRRRRRRDDPSSDDDNDSSSDEESSHKNRSKIKSLILAAIGQLSHLDAAFVRRSDGSWTYAIVADGDQNAIRFVVNERGSTKSYPAKLWGSSVRRIRVLTQREGDRFLFADMTDGCNSGRRRRSVGMRGRGRGSSKGKGRLTSPSPTRRNIGVLNIPPTIEEHKRHGKR